MSWKDEITSIEEENDWKSAIHLIERVNGNDSEIYLRVMFLLLDLLVEGQYTREDHDYAAKRLKDIFDNADDKFYDDAQFLFFCGIMIYIGEWYFGMSSVDTATTMLEKAMRIEPGNTLYKWGYYSRIDQRLEQNTDLKLQLSKQLLFEDTAALEFLKRKGLLGKYVLGTLETLYGHLNEEKNV